MTSTIKVDTISENTSANGVAVDGVTLKDGGITIANAGQIGSAGDADSIAIASNGVVTFSQAPVFPDGSIAVADLDIDGATDIGAAIVDADLFIIDDGAGGTNRKVTAARIKTYAGADFGSAGTAKSLAGIPFYRANNSIYTHDVSGTDDTAANNTAYGTLAMDAITTGDNNTAIGHEALTANTTGAGNVAIGANSLDLCDTEGNNLSIGLDSMHGSIAGGEFNVAIGNNSLDALTSADNNVAIGYEAGSALTTTNNNVFVGYKAGVLATTCEDNVCIGMEAAADGVWTGDDNVVIGKRAGKAFTSAYNNVLVGKDAGHSISTGGGNVCIGKASGQDPGSTPITTGTDNIFIGNGTNTQASDGVNAIGIGTNFTVAANNFSFGKQSNVVSNVFTSDANWARASDERLKTNITSVSWDSLDFINAIRPVTFTWRNSNAVPTDMDEYDADKNHMDTTTVIDGLIAQEVKTAMDAHNMTNFSGWKTSSLGTQTLSKEAFVIPLIKAVQELSAKVKALEDA